MLRYWLQSQTAFLKVTLMATHSWGGGGQHHCREHCREGLFCRKSLRTWFAWFKLTPEVVKTVPQVKFQIFILGDGAKKQNEVDGRQDAIPEASARMFPLRISCSQFSPHFSLRFDVKELRLRSMSAKK